jgi:hypothetical protein
MTAVTELADAEIHIPGLEIVQVSALDGYTYTSKKFGTVKAAVATYNADLDTAINATVSGNVVTLNLEGETTTARAVSLLLSGQLGN